MTRAYGALIEKEAFINPGINSGATKLAVPNGI
jgi:hypothetical protein